MDIAIIEDRPWKMKKSIQMMQNMDLKVTYIFYVCESDSVYEETKKEIDHMCQKLKLECIRISARSEFEETMNQYYYKEKQLIFLCDLNLSGDVGEYFDKRINVKYAMKLKEKEGGELNRLWFYTTSGEDTNEQINTHFEGHNIPIEKIDDDQVIFDFGEIQKIAAKNGTGQ